MNTEPNIKNRVTGAIVLIALAIIFLPLILDGHKKNQTLESKIPAKPETGEIVLVKIGAKSDNSGNKSNIIKVDDIIKNIADNKVSSKPVSKITKPTLNQIKVPTKKTKEETIKEISETKVVKSIPTIKEVKSSVKPRTNRPNYKSSAYVIQLGSFGNKTNAKNLVDKLKKAGYKAYLKSVTSNGQTINRVIVGPELKRKSAEKKIPALNKLSGLKAIILGYDPLIH